MNIDILKLLPIVQALPARKLVEAIKLAYMIVREQGELNGPNKNAVIARWLAAVVDLVDDLTPEELAKLRDAIVHAFESEQKGILGIVAETPSSFTAYGDADLLSNKARKAAGPAINLSVLPIDAILNAYSLTVQLILAIRDDMTPEQRKAGWLWLEKIQKLIDAALQPK